ncbi:hypothetical protein [Serratia fonticola]
MDKQVTNKTLLEILVDELPGLGGWHEGACNIAQDKSGIAWFYRERPRFVRTVWAGDSDKDVELPLATDHATAIITREQYEQALAEKNKPVIPVMPQAWSGEGLPPVGTVCEHCPGGTTQTEWEVVKVLAINERPGGVFTDFWLQRESGSSYIVGNPYRFRPIRTPEQIEAERRELVTKQMFDVWSRDGNSTASASFYSVYDAIRAGKIEGVKIDG